MDWEGEVEIEEDFGGWSWRERLDLIWEVLRGGSYMFTGEEHIEIEPPDYY